jgi:hypothetical protein
MYFTLDDRRIRHAARNIEQGGSLTIIATAPTGRRAGDRKSEAGSWNTATITERQSHSRCAAIQAATTRGSQLRGRRAHNARSGSELGVHLKGAYP